MQQFEHDVEDFEDREKGKVFVKFYTRPVQDEAESDKQGRPIYNEVEYLEIRAPGNATNIVQRPVTDMDKRRFRRQYEMFKEGNEEQLVGTPLTEVTWVTRSQAEELSYLRIRTLEQLAEVGDDVCTRIPGLFKLKQRAQTTVETATKNAPILELTAKLESLANENATLKKAVEEQAATIKKLSAEKK